jgi:malonate-semialdehyde dehydrogenase (acetylating)/methylmalonate-semialdehyde dehydrogenase
MPASAASPQSRDRISSLIEMGTKEGASLLLDGRFLDAPELANGSFLKPTILENVHPNSELAGTEIFGPVMGLMHAETFDEALAWVNSGRYGNMACLFTSDGAAARRFRHEVQAGNIGINIGVAAPMAFFPFSGWKDSFFGTLHAQSGHSVEFYTQTKVVVERWLKEWSRQF